ncbi:beta-lactamase family protein (plasmid) [Rhizobium tropici CIAT 899]|uniref:Beta-lactamase n=1 Tax=Rhizobium tropici TaxID=398 RepID=A0ABR6R0L7_RHITR|nr:beta-lactamase family protein [Rhizobium tropici CIAT 899]MBB4242306.1 beta-lactamase class C [Rhizobium tropici]MBB5593669.1 beta-lactamase class C [Rhizobium tropici]MBB6492631.1 beta-lactamase class C [Rhizobium tropici]
MNIRTNSLQKLGIVAGCLFYGVGAHAADGNDQDRLERAVNEVVRPLMKENDVPGMAIALTVKGKRYVFNYGVASKESGQKVTNDTIFELGSISKTFTATLGSYAQINGKLSFSDKATKYMPELAGSGFDRISLLDLATYSAGGLPLQFPNGVTDQDKMVAYYRNWHPSFAPGAYRQYSNPSIGLFGYLAAQAVGEPFDTLMQDKILPGLGLRHTYVRVPPAEMANYAYGYSKQGKPIRVNGGVFDTQAYGIKTTSSDMLAFLEANMGEAKLDDKLQQAIDATHVGYYRVDNTTQALGWEIYAYPTTLARLLAGNSSEMAFEPHKVTRLAPPQQPRKDVLLNKTGSTNGFGAYAAFIPAKQIGIVLLANRNFPIPARVAAAYKILTAVEDMQGSNAVQ